MFLIPATIFLKFSLIGTLLVSDILVAVVLPFIMLAGRLRLEDTAKKILILGVVWFFGQVLSDIINQTPPEDFLRGWFRILTTLLTFVVLLFLVDNQIRRVYFMLAGTAVGVAINSISVWQVWAPGLLWKFGVGTGLTLAVLLWVNRKRFGQQNLSILVLFLGATISLLLNARAQGGHIFIACLFSYISARSSNIGHLNISRKFIRILPVSILMIVASGVLLQSYLYMASEGYLGQDALSKYRMQVGDTSNNPIAQLFVCGRSEFLISLDAIADSPLIGHGSWAKDEGYRLQMFREKLAAGCEVSEYFLEESNLIPTHSILFGTWVESGVLGGIFWLFVIWVVMRGLVTAFGTRAIPITIFTFIVFWFSWDILFSPFGGTRRIIVPAMLCTCIKFTSMVAAQRR